MGVLLEAVLFSFLMVCSFALNSNDLQARYDFELNLEFQQPGATPFNFFYTYDSEKQLLKMAVEVLNLGWVGIGFSHNQLMLDSDIAIGWVNESGIGFLQVSS